jgi:hypothetical protein
MTALGAWVFSVEVSNQQLQSGRSVALINALINALNQSLKGVLAGPD